jgi:probable phosphoglycerate mutase
MRGLAYRRVTELLLVRHGETDWNAESRWQGQADPSLNALGRQQAEALAGELAGERFDAVYSSDLRRALETATIVSERLAVPVVPLSGLREIDVGSWSGLTVDEVRECLPGGLERLQAHGYGWDGGETPDELQRRVVRALREIVAAHPGGRVLVVTHGGVVRAIGAEAAGVPYADYRRQVAVVGNCTVSRLACENGIFRPVD